MDVYNRFAITAEDKLLDASNFVEWLDDWRNKGHYAKYRTNQAGQLDAAIFSMPNAIEYWAQNKDWISILFDTTFNTNAAGLKLGLITAVDNEGYTRILFVCVVATQTATSFGWLFESLLDFVHVAPATIFTDSDLAMALAIRLHFPTTIHLLCTWHLSLNLVTNLKGLAGSRLDAIKKKYWQICKEPDVHTRMKFDSEFAELVALIPKPNPTDIDNKKKYEMAMEWLDGLKNKKEKWAARWCWQHMTVGS